ncbi:hypothetical protein EGW08_014917 [Elysia chlorotica]|uniref:Reverse transcriptase domain-containing protein n=1 Tax=Elysia chlorotica TaxID=188477 RepID=A0A433T6Z2_ELYCH|nr:hypothetical protein EGW08_014917 [Elysia chlorotica]
MDFPRRQDRKSERPHQNRQKVKTKLADAASDHHLVLVLRSSSRLSTTEQNDQLTGSMYSVLERNRKQRKRRLSQKPQSPVKDKTGDTIERDQGTRWADHFKKTSFVVIHDGKLMELFNVQTGVRQGCSFSPTIFLMVVDWVMKQPTTGRKTCIQWTFMCSWGILTLQTVSAFFPKSNSAHKGNYNCVAKGARKTGLRINTRKTEAMRINNNQANALPLRDENIEEVNKFVYLGSVVSKDGDTDEDTRCQINNARYDFNTLISILRFTPL